MSIELNGVTGSQGPQKPETRQSKERGGPSDAQPVERAQARADSEVELSRDAEQLRRLEARVEEAESFDRERVEQLAQAIAEDRYPVDSARIAERFLDLETKLYR